MFQLKHKLSCKPVKDNEKLWTPSKIQKQPLRGVILETFSTSKCNIEI